MSPKIAATRLKLKKPINPQFRAPIITSIKVIDFQDYITASNISKKQNTITPTAEIDNSLSQTELQEQIEGVLNQRKGRRRTSTAAKAARFKGVGRNAPAGDTSPCSLISSSEPLHPEPTGGKSRPSQSKKSKCAFKTGDIALPPAMSSDDVDLYDEEL